MPNKFNTKYLLSILYILSYLYLFYSIFLNVKLGGAYFEVIREERFGFCVMIMSFISLFAIFYSKLKISAVDFFVLIFGIYNVIVFYITNSLCFDKLWLLIVLGLLYFNTRVAISINHRFKSLIIVMIIVTGGIEAIRGILQVFGYSSSNHSLFNITGSFFNPGPFGGYIAIVLSLSLPIVFSGYKYFDNARFKMNRIQYIDFYYIFSILSFIFMSIVLPATMSRTAWFALFVSCFVYACNKLDIKKVVIRHKVVTCLVILLILCSAIFAYMMKKESADGRLLIWRVSLEASKSNPIIGTGLGSFGGEYASAQRNILELNPNYKLTAGAPEYSFNEYLGFAVEIGYLGLLIFILIIISALKGAFKQGVKGECIALGLITLLVFAFASYPFALIPFTMLLVIFLAMGGSVRSGLEYNIMIKIIIAITVFFSSVYGCKVLDKNSCFTEWRKIQFLYNSKMYESIAKDYDELYPFFEGNYKFLFEYGHTLGFVGRYQDAINILEQGRRLSSDPMFLNIIGNNYKALGDNYEASHNYNMAYKTVPSRIYPLYLLVKLYDEIGDKEQVIFYANKINEQKDKIKSPATVEMRGEVKKILEKYN